MTKKEIDLIIKKYDEKLDKYGVSSKTLGWDKDRAKLRFKILLNQWDIEGTKLLDFGCGFGDMLDIFPLIKKQPNDYLGVDINPKLIDIAKEKHPDVRFQVINLLETDLEEYFDYSFASGVFNFKLANNLNFIEEIIHKLWISSNKGIGINFLSTQVDYKLSHAYHANPIEMLSLAYKYTNNVVLRNDYMPYEFSLFLNKSDKVDPERTVYETYLPYS